MFEGLYIHTAQDSMQQERRNSIHHNRESLFQPSRSMECWGSWRYDRLASEGSSQAEMDSNEAKLGSEVGNQCNDGRESLSFRVRASDGRYSTSWHITPKNWQFGQTFEGKNFK
jgi:hypothetical protein